jgi:hypothetical protein
MRGIEYNPTTDKIQDIHYFLGNAGSAMLANVYADALLEFFPGAGTRTGGARQWRVRESSSRPGDIRCTQTKTSRRMTGRR